MACAHTRLDLIMTTDGSSVVRLAALLEDDVVGDLRAKMCESWTDEKRLCVRARRLRVQCGPQVG